MPDNTLHNLSSFQSDKFVCLKSFVFVQFWSQPLAWNKWASQSQLKTIVTSIFSKSFYIFTDFWRRKKSWNIFAQTRTCYFIIFHRIEKVELALLHCKDCTERTGKRCCEKYPIYLPAQEIENNGLWHLDLSKYLEDGRIKWQAIKILVRTENRL